MYHFKVFYIQTCLDNPWIGCHEACQMMQETTPVMFCDIGQMNCWPLTITVTENAEPYGCQNHQKYSIFFNLRS